MRRKKHSTVGAFSLLMISLFAVGAAAQTADLPRAEYPRPQFARADWLNLNGEWESSGTTPMPASARAGTGGSGGLRSESSCLFLFRAN